MSREVERFETISGGRIYRLPLEVFPGFWGYAHLVLGDGIITLVDVGSGFGDSNQGLEEGLTQVKTRYGETAGWDDLTHVLLTHGHIDHFGGLQYVQARCSAPVGVHELDYRVLTQYEERLAIMAMRLREYLLEAGVPQLERDALMRLYLTNKELFESVEVDFTYQSVRGRVGPLEVTHVPGHCPGQVVLRYEGILLTGDHVLAGISPHQAPERLSLNTGLGHYLESLRKLRPMAGEVRLALGGHEQPIDNLPARLMSIEALHLQRLRRILGAVTRPKTIMELTEELFPDVEGYQELLALEEAGAHVEYLEQRGFLSIANSEEVENEVPCPIVYGGGSRPREALEDTFADLTQVRPTGGDTDVRV